MFLSKRPGGRRLNRLQYFDYSRPGKYSVTLVTEKRTLRFGTVIVADHGVGSDHGVGADPCVGPAGSDYGVGADPCVGPAIPAFVELSDLGNIIETFWNRLPNKFPNIVLDEFVIMPNHVHGIIRIIDVDASAVCKDDARVVPTNRIRQYIHDNPKNWLKDNHHK